MATLPNVNSGDPHVAAHNAERAEVNAHGANSANPHGVTKAQVGLGSVDNTADTAKPVSTAQATAINAVVPAHVALGDPHTQYQGPRGLIGTTVDINTYIATGFYRVSSPSGILSANMPTAKVGFLEVITYSFGTNSCSQTYWEDLGETYTRSMISGVWKPWVRLDNMVGDARFLIGTGQPEGVIAAPVGTEYTDTAKTAGAFKWIKNTGTSTTGWVVTHGDTGSMDISSLIDIRVDGIAWPCFLRRMNNIVDLFIDVTAPTDLTSPWVLLNLPIGFRPGNTRYGAFSFYQEGITRQGLIGSTVNWYNIKAGRDRAVATFPTPNAWPTVLPV